jgi:hypothetical protein
MSKSTHVLKILLTLSLLSILLMQADLTQLYQTFSQLSVVAVLLALLLTFSALWVGAVKWHLLLPNYAVTLLFKLNLIATYYAIVLPGQLIGEAVKAYRLGKGRLDAEHIAASVVIDKLTGFLGILIVGLLGLGLSTHMLPTMLIWLFLIATLGLSFALFIAALFAPPLKSFFHYLAATWPRSQRFMRQLERLLAAWRVYLNQPLSLFISMLLAMLFQCICVLNTIVLAHAFDLAVAWQDWCWVFAVVSLAVFLPLTIAGIGLREGAFVGTLALLHIPPEQALALSFSIFGLNLIKAAVGGMLELMLTTP